MVLEKTEFTDYNKILTPKPIRFNSNFKYNLVHSTHGKVTVKMLNFYRDGNEHHYRDICKALFPDKNIGHDYDIWKSLVKHHMIAFSSKHKHGSMFYKITPAGEEVLAVADANQPYYRVMRWYGMEEDEMISEMVKADLNGEEAYKDRDPETLIALLEELFNPSSKMRTLGSAYRWMNKVIDCLKRNSTFYDDMTSEEVMKWLEASKDKWPEIYAYLNVLRKVSNTNGKFISYQNAIEEAKAKVVVGTTINTNRYRISTDTLVVSRIYGNKNKVAWFSNYEAGWNGMSLTRIAKHIANGKWTISKTAA